MSLLKLARESFIEISHSPGKPLLHVDWKGYQSIESAHEGCEHILDAMVHTGADSVLNDNTHVLGTWSAAAEWVAVDWFPRMRQAGLRRFAWVYSPSKLSQLSTDTTTRLLNRETFGIRIFHSKSEALTWLSHESSKTIPVQKRRPRVLVIEDNPDFSEVFHSMLHTMGCTPDIAGTAGKGLAMAKAIVPDMIFCDISLPGMMDGYDFAAAVRSDSVLKNIPLIAISGTSSEKQMACAVNAGFNRFFPKPIKFADISQALASFHLTS